MASKDVVDFTEGPRFKELRDANARIAKRGRLPWLLDFSRRRLSEAGPGELSDLGLEVLAFAGAWGGYYELAGADLGREQLERIQGELGQGLHAVFSLQNWPALHEGRTYIGPDTSGLAPAGGQPPKGAIHDGVVYRLWLPLKRHYQLQHPSVPGLFALAAEDEVVAGWDQVRRCPECERFFAPVRRQRFCSLECTQAKMNARKARKKKPRRAGAEVQGGTRAKR